MFRETVSKTALLLSILCTWIKIATGDLSETPRDTEAVVGLTTFFNCSTKNTTDEIHWFHYPDGDDQQRHLVYGYNKIYSPYEGRFRVEKDSVKGVYNLVIAAVELKDFGKYQCQDDFGKGKEHSAQLTVLESQPICGSSMKPEGVIGANRCGFPPEYLHLTCRVTFKGSRTPSIVWIKNGTESAIIEGVTLNNSSNHVTLNLTLAPNSVVDGDVFQCRTTASAAEEQYTCTPDTVKVNHGSDDVWFHVLLSALLAAAVVLWLVFCGFCLKLSIERRRERNSKRSDSEKHELKPLAKNNLSGEDDPKQLKDKNERLMEKVADLETNLYFKGKIDYLPVPKLVHTTPTEKAKTIKGIAILSGELFAVFENSSYIEVLDSVTFVSKPSFTGVESTDVKDLLWNPQDIAASKVNGCLYVIHQTIGDKKAEIWKIDAINRRKVHQWPLECRIGRLSTHEYSVIVFAVEEKKIIEYSLEGELLRPVSLCPVDGFDHLWHAIKVTGEHYLVSNKDDKNRRHRICLVNTSGRIVSRAEESKKLILDTPICLTEDKDRSILVLNAKSAKNTSITVLSTDLVYSRKTLKLSTEGYSVRICLDDCGSQLFVAVNDGDPSTEIRHSGRIDVYGIVPTVKLI